jgi:molecular chaperone DnaK
MRVTVSRDAYEKKIERLVDRCLLNIEKALQGTALNKDDIDGILLVGGSTQTPRIREMIGLKFGKEPYAGINPLEAVAIGAAVQGGILAGGTRDILLLDVTPFTLAIETEGGVATPLVAKNSSIPLERKSVFSTAEDNQTAVTVKVFEGEDELTKENRLLGEFNLEGIPRAARGVPQIEVQFDIDANGILSVGAKELGTGKEMVVRMS